MSLFRKYITLILSLFIFLNSEAQQLGEFDVRKGVAPFFLASVRTQLDSSIKLAQVGKMDYNGRTEIIYAYYALSDQPYILEGISLKYALLTYVSDTLIRVTLNNLYLPRHFPDYKKRARNDYRKLSFVLTTQWKRAGSARKFLQSPDKRIISRGFQWDTDSARMKLALYEDKSKHQPLSDVSVTWEIPRYE
jgi:hypothetical protein